MTDIEKAIERWREYAVKHGDRQDWSSDEDEDGPIITYSLVGCGCHLTWCRFDEQGFRDEIHGEYDLEDGGGFPRTPFDTEAILQLWAHRMLEQWGYSVSTQTYGITKTCRVSLEEWQDEDLIEQLDYENDTLLDCYLDAVKAAEGKK